VKVHHYVICGIVATSIQAVMCLLHAVLCVTVSARHTLPEDGPIGPKHVGAKRYFTVCFNILCV